MEQARVGLFPPALPGIGITVGVDAPLPRVGHITDGRVEPDVDLLALGFGHIEGNRHAPVRVAGDAAGAEIVHPTVGNALHVGAPLGVGFEPLLELALKLGQIKEPVAGIFQHRHGAVAGDVGTGCDEILRRILSPTALAFVAVGLFIAALRAGAAHVAIRQEAVGLLGIPELNIFLVDVAVLEELGEKTLRGVRVEFPGGAAIDVVGDAQALEGGLVGVVVAVDDFLGRDALLEGRERDGHAVFVRSADIKDGLATQAHIADVDVGGKIGPGDVAKVNVAVGIGERAGDQGALEFLFGRHGDTVPVIAWADGLIAGVFYLIAGGWITGGHVGTDADSCATVAKVPLK